MCADCVGGVKRMPFTYGWSVQQHGAWGGWEPARGPIKWSIGQLSRFLREPTIAELLDHDRSEHPETCPGKPG